MTKKEIELAILQNFDGNLGEKDLLELRETLKSQPEARQTYYRLARLHQKLDFHFGGKKSEEVVNVIASTRFEKQKRRALVTTAIVSTVVFVLLGVVLNRVLVPEPAGRVTTTIASRFDMFDTDGRLTTNTKRGELEVGTSIELTQGSLEVNLKNGTRAVMLAPSRFTLQSEEMIVMPQGIGWFRLGANSKGFQVITPRLKVTDIGTEFGVHAVDEVEEVHVFSGEVIVQSMESYKTKRLLKGDALKIEQSGDFAPIENCPLKFLDNLPRAKKGDCIANGGFEAGNRPADNSWGMSATKALLPSWNFASGEVHVAYKTEAGVKGYGKGSDTIVSSTKDTLICFKGPGLDQSKKMIWQSFATEPNQRYEVGFEMGAVLWEEIDDRTDLAAEVYDGAGPTGSAGKLLAQKIESRTSSDKKGFNKPAKFTFVAKSKTSTLVIREEILETKSSDPVVDNVFVRAVN